VQSFTDGSIQHEWTCQIDALINALSGDENNLTSMWFRKLITPQFKLCSLHARLYNYAVIMLTIWSWNVLRNPSRPVCLLYCSIVSGLQLKATRNGVYRGMSPSYW